MKQYLPDADRVWCAWPNGEERLGGMNRWPPSRGPSARDPLAYTLGCLYGRTEAPPVRGPRLQCARRRRPPSTQYCRWLGNFRGYCGYPIRQEYGPLYDEKPQGVYRGQ